MGLNITQKIIKEHLVSGEMIPGQEVGIKIDQTLTQDATGTMAYLQFRAMDIPRVKTELSVSYVDHNTLQADFKNADDHIFLQTVAKKHGVYFSKPGNGICHQVHLERFGRPGKTLLGSDSHTPTGGGIGMLAIGAGGLDVAVAMAGQPFYFPMPKIVRVELKNRLRPWVSSKDVILHLLSILTVKGGVNKIMEYGGEGVASLSVPERATITNMGAELGATTSIFPSDENTRKFLEAQGRVEDYVPLAADPDATYDEVIVVDLAEIVPLAACPHSPDNIKPIAELDLKVDQVVIGSCTNSSYTDMKRVSEILKGKRVHPDVSLAIAPGSRQVLEILARDGSLADLIAAGARILESACGPCIGMGQAPRSGAVSLRTFNRNFEGRSGTKDASVFLVSPETAAASAITGKITDPRTLGEYIPVGLPERFLVDDSMILPPAENPDEVEVIMGPNIKPVPIGKPLESTMELPVSIKVGDNITTDHIMPAGAKVLPFRSNIPAISEFVFSAVDPSFPERAKELGKSVIIGGQNYGQGSSREHAALAPMYLGVKAVIAKSFARIHKANLVNFGILPLEFADPEDYDSLEQGDVLIFSNLIESLKSGEAFAKNTRTRKDIKLTVSLSSRQVEIIEKGGLLAFAKAQAEN
ncbi:MAG: aconitate hydratase [Bacillota bacterium]|jgi:aconitate hydratase|nr:aconitate hydratase [Bacillota bacterium]HOP54194.1 aconitate hydratase [Bacillota bacterium]HPT61976.1 aconitate hydratase [Bacillota bacterium]